jgi:hypothetical protein
LGLRVKIMIMLIVFVLFCLWHVCRVIEVVEINLTLQTRYIIVEKSDIREKKLGLNRAKELQR